MSDTAAGGTGPVAPIGTIRGLIDRQAAAMPDKVFLVCPTSCCSITYRQLRGSATGLAADLLARGFACGDKIAIVRDNGLQTAQIFLGLLYGGFVPVPLNLTSGASHLSYVVKHSAARALYVEPQYGGLIEEASSGGACQVPTVLCTPENPTGAVGGRGGSLPEFEAGDDAILDFTSGSTGTPKGVVVTHRNVLAGASNTVAAHALTHKDRSLCVLPLYHMNAQVVTLIATLMSGGSVVLPRRFEAGSFWQWLARHKCTWCALVPSMIGQLLAMEKTGRDLSAAARRSLRFLRCSSAPLAVSHHERFEGAFRIPLLEAMGSTEAGGAIFSNPLPPAPRKAGSAGKPYGFEVRIVHEDSRAGAFAEGDIQVRGPSVMKQYYKDPDGTAEVITPDGWLKTGDRGSRDEDGYYFISGRRRELINKAGEKIAPREIDDIISCLPGVSEAATVGVPDPEFGEDIVTYVVPNRSPGTSQDEILQHCAKELGLFKTPRHVVFVETLPKGPTGKVLRPMLVEQFLNSTTSGSGRGLSPLSYDKLVSRLTALWEKVLDRDRITPTDNFFELGGHSLLAVRLILRIEKEFSVKPPFSALFANPTVEGLANVINALRKGLFPTPLLPIKGSGIAPPFFAVYGMENVVVFRTLASRLRQDQPFYALPALGLDASDKPYRNLETMAATYLQIIRSVQPRGPYFLGGRCFGSPVALEIALQLLKIGEEMALLVIFDSGAPLGLGETPISPGSGRNRLKAPLGRRLYRHLHGRTLSRTLLRFIQETAREGSARISSLTKTYLSGRDAKYLLRIKNANRSLRSNHRSAVYPRQITLIRSECNAATPERDFSVERWRKIAGGGLEIYTVPGNHTTIFDEPNVDRLAQLLEGFIQKARGAS